MTPGPVAPVTDPLAGPEAAVAEALGRAGIYRLLGRAFAYPTELVVQEVGRLAGELAEGPATPGVLRDALDRFATAVLASDAATVAAEHVFLFHRQVQCPPYEGAYGPSDPFAAGKSAALADIAGFYAAFGLEPAAGQPDVEDHVAAELEFMSVLAVKEAYARAEDDGDGLAVTRETQVRFLTDHLGCWAETFAEGVRAATPVPYFVAVADLLLAWVRREIATLGATPTRFAAPTPRGPAEEDRFTCPMAEAVDEPRDDGRTA